MLNPEKEVLRLRRCRPLVLALLLAGCGREQVTLDRPLPKQTPLVDVNANYNQIPKGIFTLVFYAADGMRIMGPVQNSASLTLQEYYCYDGALVPKLVPPEEREGAPFDEATLMAFSQLEDRIDPDACRDHHIEDYEIG